MAYRDPNRVKSTDGIKCRLDIYDQDRLEHYLEDNGGQAAPTIRQALNEFLDRRGIKYQAKHKNEELEQRLLVIAIGDRVQVMKSELENSGYVAEQAASQMVQQ